MRKMQKLAQLSYAIFRHTASVRACAAGGRALPLHPAPTRRAAGLCPCTPRLRGGRRGSAPAPRACAAGGGALPLHPAPARRAAGLCPAPRACAASGRALPCTRWGFTPNPEMLTHLPRLRAGRGALVPSLHAPRPSPPLWQRAGLACGCARVLSSHSALPPEPHWQNVASGVRAASSLRS